MLKARFFLVVLICASPAVLLWDGLLTQAVVSGWAAAALAIVATTLRPGETGFLMTIIRPAAIVAVVPAICMLFQLTPFRPLAHPVWVSADAAVGHPLADTITIDRGASLIAFGQYLLFCSVVTVAAAVAVERVRAEAVLFALTAAGAAIGVILLAQGLVFPHLLSAPAHGEAGACVAMGVIIAAAACIRTLERYETHQSTPQRSISILMWTFAACGAAFVLCTLALFLTVSLTTLIAAACGLAALGCIETIRRFGLGPWGTVGVIIPVFGVSVLALAAQATSQGSILLALGSTSAPSSFAVAKRVLGDAPVFGTGAGTYDSITPVYREVSDPPADAEASTGAAIMAIELGRPIAGFIAAVTLAAIVLLFRASLQRGRDSFYPALGASCLIALLLLAFISRGLLGNAAALIAASVLGLAIAQSKSRSLQHV